MITRNGKIARLPRPLREELNHRLENGEPGNRLLQWLNDRPEVKEMLARDFDGRGISKQNLSEWRNGGFAEWWARQEHRGEAEELAAEAQEIETSTGGRLGDHLATVLEARYASVLMGWNGEFSSGFALKLKVMRELCRDVAGLRRGDHQAARLQLVRDKVELLRKRTEAEVLEHFQAWMENEKYRDWLCAHWPSPEERKRQLYAMYGMTVPGEAGSAKDQAPGTGEGSSIHEPGGAMGETANSQVQNPGKVQAPTSGEPTSTPPQAAGAARAGQAEGDVSAQIAELNRQAEADGQRRNSPMKSGPVKPGQTIPGGETSNSKIQNPEKVQALTANLSEAGPRLVKAGHVADVRRSAETPLREAEEVAKHQEQMVQLGGLVPPDQIPGQPGNFRLSS